MGILIAIIGVCIPIVAIVTSHQYKMQKLQMENGQGENGGQRIYQLEEYVRKLADENEDLKQRLNNVETIVSDPDFLLGLPAKDDSKDVQKKLESLAEQVRKNN